jgi:hypothetical protein
MAERMGAAAGNDDPGAEQGALHYPGDDGPAEAGANPVLKALLHHEDMAVGRLWASLLKVCHDCLPCIRREGKESPMPRFSPSNAHRTCSPIKILELQVSEFAGPQPETREENDDGPVPEAYCRGAIQGIQ